MAGGLLQLASSGTGDVYLTADPDITFFKIVFMRHTAFAIETVEESFDGIINFGENLSCTLNKTGDLISKMWIKIVLPNIKIPILSNSTIHPSNNINLSTIKTNLSNITIQFNNFKSYCSYLFVLWRSLLLETQSLAGSYKTILAIITNFMTTSNWNQYILYNSLFNNITTNNQNFNFDLIDLFNKNYMDQYKYSTYSLTQNEEFKTIFQQFLYLFQSQATYYNNYLFTEMQELTKLYKINSQTNYRFAWIQRIGFGMIDECNITIGGQVIDRLNADILNIWYELILNLDKRGIFNKLIGDVPELTIYNGNTKPTYTLYVPLPFWFCNNTGNALPTIGIRYHDVVINVKLKDLTSCCYFEVDENNLTDNINLNSVVRLQDISLLIDYVYIDQVEREKFGRKSLEYLIEENQMLVFNNINTVNINQLLSFTNPAKEIIWTIQDNYTLNKFKLWTNYNYRNIYQFTSVTQNTDSSGNMLLNFMVNNSNVNIGDTITITFSNYYNNTYKVVNASLSSITVKGNYVQNDYGFLEITNNLIGNNTINNAQLIMNGTNITEKIDYNYFSLVQPWKYHSIIPDSGIYVYSFSLRPEENQPSGQINMSLLDINDLSLTLSDNFYKRIIRNNDTLTLKVYIKSMNIFRVTKGQGFLEFSF